LLTILATLVLTGLLVLAFNRVPVALALALPLVFFLPGYALGLALFRRKTLGRLERGLLSVALSIAVVIAVGFVLTFTPWGLHPIAWLISLVSVTLVASAAALASGQEPLWTSARRINPVIRPGDVLLFGMGLLAIVIALQLGHIPSPADRTAGYTTMWLLPQDNNPESVSLGVSSSEFEPVRYKLVIEVDGQAAKEWNNIVLEPGQEWRNAFDLPPLAEDKQEVEALLYRADSPGTVYRNVTLKRQLPEAAR
jgi:uncharacterized membrane protein